MDAIRIRHGETALVGCPLFQIENAAGEKARRPILEEFPSSPDFLISDAQQRQCLLPFVLSLLAISDCDRGIAVVVTLDLPFKPQVQQRWRFNNELSRGDGIGAG